jgi:hypothetical protein
VAFGGDDLAPSAVWTSDNAAVWQPADGAAGVDGRVNALATHRGSWFAVGERVDAEGGGAAVGVVWRSDDGTDWTTVADDLAVGDGTVSDVAVRDDTMVVVGFGVADGLMWTGPIDGPLRPVDGSAFAQSAIQGVAATDAGFVAVGRGLGDLRPYVWRSVDGDRWTRTALDDDVFPPDDAIHDLAAVDGGLLAVGASPDGGVVWTSDDGDTWTRAD